jgi:hypothetical protein
VGARTGSADAARAAFATPCPEPSIPAPAVRGSTTPTGPAPWPHSIQTEQPYLRQLRTTSPRSHRAVRISGSCRAPGSSIVHSVNTGVVRASLARFDIHRGTAAASVASPDPSVPVVSGPVVGDKNFPMPGARTCKLGERDGRVMPDPRRTPGAIDSAVTELHSRHAKNHVTGW